MNIIEILNSNKKTIKANMNLLSKVYTENTGRKVCRTCPSDIQYMLLSLRNIYKMTQFKFIKPFVQYKNKKGDKKTISNPTMTDEAAVAFLRTDQSRIRLFSEYPKNWKKLIKEGFDAETAEEKEKRLAIEAELAIAEKAKKEAEEGSEGSKEAADSAETELKEELMNMKLSELREKYPEIKATSIVDFVEKVLESE